MLNDDSARVPFAAVGILLVIISTITAAYLLKMGSAGVSNSISDERDGELNYALAFAMSDIEEALNLACMYAEEEVGEKPVINVSRGCHYAGNASNVNLARLKRMVYANLSGYLEANYNGSFTYGDYVVSARIDGDDSSVGIKPVTMNLTRTVFHPILQCRDRYGAYFVATVPVMLHVTKPGTDFDHSGPYNASTLVTSRYPLLKELTDEYEHRLNGTAMFTDTTAASFAYTWARGYCQYFTGKPLNIVDSGDLDLIANAASLLEQGCVFNSVDPLSLASLVKHTFYNSRPTRDVVENNRLSYINQYNFSNTSRASLPANKEPEEYRFNADTIVDRETALAIADPLSRYYVDRAYGCRVHVMVHRKPLTGTYNDSGSLCKESYTLIPDDSGTGPFFREIWKVWANDSIHSWGEEVTVDYIMDDYSMLDSHNDVLKPHSEAAFLSYVDSNLLGAVDSYNRLLPVDEILFERGRYPEGCSGPTREVTCPHNEWVENEAVKELKALAKDIRGDTGVTLKVSDYRSYDEMMNAAYQEMRFQFQKNYTRYLAEDTYEDKRVFMSCGAKYIFHGRSAFLKNIDDALNASINASAEIDGKIDDALKNYSGSVNSSAMKDNAISSRDLLKDRKMFIPFGLRMGLQSRNDSSGPYRWTEEVSLAIDQRPNYLDVEEYTDPETGYRVRPLKLRNVCVFSLPTDFVASDQACKAVLDGIDAVSGTAYRLANRTLTAESTKLIKDVSSTAKMGIKDRINDVLVHDGDLQGKITRDDVEKAVNDVFSRRTPEQTVSDLKNGALQKEIAGILGGAAKKQAEREIAKKADRYVDSYCDYIEGKAEVAVNNAIEDALSDTIKALSDRIKQTFKDYMAEAMGHGEDEAVMAALGRIPSGLPLLPPFGWWATMNVWYIEIKGEIPYLAVYDTDNVPIPDPILGHKATVYVRRPEVIRDDEGILGLNEPVHFNVKTCVFILVPPGEQGIGDKWGGWDEKSSGFDEESSV
jgi:hypothetical protein